MFQIARRCSRVGRSTKKTLSNLSALENSGGSLLMSLQVATKNTSLVWSLSQVSKLPNNLDDTPESVWPELAAPLSAFSISSTISTQGAMASAILSACRVRSSV